MHFYVHPLVMNVSVSATPLLEFRRVPMHHDYSPLLVGVVGSLMTLFTGHDERDLNQYEPF